MANATSDQREADELLVKIWRGLGLNKPVGADIDKLTALARRVAVVLTEDELHVLRRYADEARSHAQKTDSIHAPLYVKKAERLDGLASVVTTTGLRSSAPRPSTRQSAAGDPRGEADDLLAKIWRGVALDQPVVADIEKLRALMGRTPIVLTEEETEALRKARLRDQQRRAQALLDTILRNASPWGDEAIKAVEGLLALGVPVEVSAGQLWVLRQYASEARSRRLDTLASMVDRLTTAATTKGDAR